MTAGDIIALADAERPNSYSTAQKLRWLERIDGQVRGRAYASRADDEL